MIKFNFNLYRLAWDCSILAGEAVEHLRGPVTEECIALLHRGFWIPSPDALETAAANFHAITEMKGGRGWLWTSHLENIEPSCHVDVICALASAWLNFPEQFDMAWSGRWDQFAREHALTASPAMDVMQVWHSGSVAELNSKMEQDALDDYNEWGRNH